MRRLAILAVSLAALLAAMGAFVAAAREGDRGAEIATPVAPPTVQLIHPGHLPAPSAGTFVSLVPSCGCNIPLGLVQFSLRDGHRLGTLATIAGFNPPEFQSSDPHPGPPGSFDLTFSRGPLCQLSLLGGPPATLCSPQPHTCTSVVERVNPIVGSVTTVCA
jgi:hypothetical protein